MEGIGGSFLGEGSFRNGDPMGDGMLERGGVLTKGAGGGPVFIARPHFSSLIVSFNFLISSLRESFSFFTGDSDFLISSDRSFFKLITISFIEFISPTVFMMVL